MTVERIYLDPRNKLVDGRPDYDLIVYVASWPQQRIDAWDALLKARAIESGTSRMKKHPFIRPTVNSIKQRVIEKIAQGTDEYISKVMEGK